MVQKVVNKLDPRRKAEASDSRGGAEVHDDPYYYGTGLCPMLDRASQSRVRVLRATDGATRGNSPPAAASAQPM